MSRLFAIGLTSAFITRIQEQVFDPQLIATLQQRLAAHGAQLQGQLPEILLRSNSPEEAIRSWLSDKDLSHWVPQSQGGSAEQGWQLESASWNRSRGAQPMTPLEVGRAHVDGGFDAVQAPGVAADIAGHCFEAAIIATAIAATNKLVNSSNSWPQASAEERKRILNHAMQHFSHCALRSAFSSKDISIALLAAPGAEIRLPGGSICSGIMAPPRDAKDTSKAFTLHSPNKSSTSKGLPIKR